MKRDGSSQLISVSQSSSTDGICSKVNSTVRTISFPILEWICGGDYDERSHIVEHNVDLSDCGPLGCDTMTQVCVMSQLRRPENLHTLASRSNTRHARVITVPPPLIKEEALFPNR
jgi:hypothetical protein